MFSDDLCELAHTGSGPRAIFLAPEGLILGMGHSGDLVSQGGEKPSAHSQVSFNANECESTRLRGAKFSD
jgi:hypothetical protein